MGEPTVPQRRTTPMRFDDYMWGTLPGNSGKGLRSSSGIFGGNDTIVTCIHDRFDQPRYDVLTTESLLMEAFAEEDYMRETGYHVQLVSQYTFAYNCSGRALSSM